MPNVEMVLTPSGMFYVFVDDECVFGREAYEYDIAFTTAEILRRCGASVIFRESEGELEAFS